MHIIILLLIGFLLSCCTDKRTYPKAMLQAENCIITYPDSALFYLSTLKNEIKNEPEETQMYYNLLTIKAEDKLYIPHTSDSLIKVITKFYEEYDDNDKLMEAYYYMGSTYRDMKDAPQALKVFQEVINLGRQVNKKYDILAQTYGQMSTLFTWQELYNESLECCKQALELHTLLKNDAKVSMAIRNIARLYNIQGKRDSALYYYNKAYKSALDSQNSKKINSLLSEIGCFYYDIGKINVAKEMLLKAVEEKYDIKNALLNLGLIYQYEKRLDSAQYYFYKTIQYNDIYKKRHAYLHLSQIEEEKRNYFKALEFRCKLQEIRDSIDVLTQTEAISKIQALYNYQHIEKENNRLILANESKKAQIYRLLFAFMGLIAIYLFTIIHVRKKKQYAIDQERKLRQIQEEQYAQSLERIENNNTQIHELEQKLHKAEENDIVNKQIIQSQKEQLEHINSQVFAARNELSLLESSLKQSHIYLLFHKAGNDETIKITEKEWAILQTAIDNTYHNFTDHLYTLHPQLSLLELRICYLIKISMQVKDIAKLLNRSKSAISIARTRLYKKFHGTEGSVDMLDKFIINL